MQQGFVLLVGLYIKGLIAVFGNLAAQVGNRALVLLLGSIIGLGGCLGLFQSGFGAGQLRFDYGNALGELCNFCA